MSSHNYDDHRTHLYITSFDDWMKDVCQPTAFATLRFPNVRRMPRNETFYLKLLARCAEADVLGARTLKLPDDGRRIRWIARREIEAGLVHYHALVKFPKRLWRHESPPGLDADERCTRFEHALIRAALKMPELFTHLVIVPSLDGCDIQVIPAARRHAEYLLKGMRRVSFDDPERVSDNLLRDSGLILLPSIFRRKR
jgi:hypothetical protein